jgi:hypothetical protein
MAPSIEDELEGFSGWALLASGLAAAPPEWINLQRVDLRLS